MRQRLQIGIGDSNVAEVAEYLRIGTTMLVLDVIEAGELPTIPVVIAPITALHQVCRDPSLMYRMRLREGDRSALQMQRFYWEACRAFISRRTECPRRSQRDSRSMGAMFGPTGERSRLARRFLGLGHKKSSCWTAWKVIRTGRSERRWIFATTSCRRKATLND